MTIDDIGQAKLLPARQLFPYLRERLAQWRTREHRVTQRMAGAAFVTESLLLFVIAKRRLGLHMFIWAPRT